MAPSINMTTWCGAFVVAAWSCVAAAGDCDVTIGNRNYKKETAASGVWWSQGLAVDYNTHCLYFSFYNGMYSSAKVDIRNKAFSVIQELSGPCWYSVDQVRGEVHAGCRTAVGGPGGLHQLDSNTRQFELTGEAGRDVWSVHYHNDTLYYSAKPELLLHTFTRGQSIRLSAPASPVWHFVVDAQGHYVFANSTGVYCLRRNGEEVRYTELYGWVHALAVDGHGAVYVCSAGTTPGIWQLQTDAPPTRLLDVECTGLTFDADGNIIYADWGRKSIVRLLQC